MTELSQSNTFALPSTQTLEMFLDAVTRSHFETPGNVLVEVRIAEWTVKIPLSEVKAARDKIKAFGGER